MKKALVLVAVLGLVGAASAEIQLFWSWTGINDPNLVYSTAQTNFLPSFEAPDAITASLFPGTHDVYLWGKFIETPQMPSYSRIIGLDLKFEGSATHGSNVAYRHKFSPLGYMRWQSPLYGIPLDGVMSAITSNGIEFLYLPDTNNDLSIKYAYGSGVSDFLIGAVQVTGAAGDTMTMSLHTPSDSPPGLGIAMEPLLDIPDPPVLPAILTFIPEPVSILLAFAGLALRRR